MSCTAKVLSSLLMLVAVACLIGCPRFAYVSVFNNSGADVRIVAAGEDYGMLPHGMTTKFRFTGQSFEVVQGSVRWTYTRQIPHGGEKGTYFDGTLRVQLESDGRLYALKAEQSPPVLRFDEQPVGFPLDPKKPNKAPEPTPGSVTLRASSR